MVKIHYNKTFRIILQSCIDLNGSMLKSQLVEHSSKNFATILFMLEHDTNIIISLKITIGKDSGKFQKAYQASFENVKFN